MNSMLTDYRPASTTEPGVWRGIRGARRGAGTINCLVLQKTPATAIRTSNSYEYEYSYVEDYGALAYG